ncbi:MAG: hypothetical protein FWE44_03920, partial [Defluviitaleaceae bacterium]|nr:hypothetical protein [Defluviitaleaceae bacterium]
MSSKKSKFNLTIAIIFSIISAAVSVLVAFLFREMGNAAERGDLHTLFWSVAIQASIFPFDFVLG